MFNSLSEYEVAEIPEELKALDISDYTRIYKFTKMVSDKKESVIDKLVTVINAAYSSNATVVTLIEGHPDSTDYYLGVINKEINQDSILSDFASDDLSIFFSPCLFFF